MISGLISRTVALPSCLEAFWEEDHLCDVVLKRQDGTEHHAHRLVLSAAGSALGALLSGRFREGEQIGAGEPVDLAASAGAVAAMLAYLYGGEPTVTASDAVELLRMADAYGLRHLAAPVIGVGDAETS